MKRLFLIIVSVCLLTVSTQAKVTETTDTLTFSKEVIVPIESRTTNYGGNYVSHGNQAHRGWNTESTVGGVNTSTPVLYTAQSSLPQFKRDMTGSFTDFKYGHYTAVTYYYHGYPDNASVTGLTSAASSYSIQGLPPIFSSNLRSVPTITAGATSELDMSCAPATKYTPYSLTMSGNTKTLILSNCIFDGGTSTASVRFTMGLQTGGANPYSREDSSVFNVGASLSFGFYAHYISPRVNGTYITGLFTDSYSCPTSLIDRYNAYEHYYYGTQRAPTTTTKTTEVDEWNPTFVGSVPSRYDGSYTTQQYTTIPEWIPFADTRNTRCRSLFFDTNASNEVIIDGGTYKGSPAISGTLIIVGKLKGSKFELFNLLTRKFIKVFVWQDYPYKSLHQ